MAEDNGPPKTKGYHRMTLDERQRYLREKHDERFQRKTFRCKHCRTILDEKSAIGHLDRCEQLSVGSEEHAKVIAEHFEPHQLLPRRAARGDDDA